MTQTDQGVDLVLPLADIIARIDQEIAVAKAAEVDGLALFIDSVTVDLSIVTTTDASGAVKVGVPPIEVEGGGGVKSTASSRLVVELGEPKANVTQALTDALLAEFNLAGTIIEAQRQLLKGIEAGSKIVPRALTLEIIFGATRSAKAKGGIKLWVAQLGGSVGRERAANNKVTLKFEARLV